MHGRPRIKAGTEDPERVKAAKQKAALFGQLSKEVLARRHAKQYDEESLALSAKLLELNPEVYTVWNFRKEALQPVLDAGGAAAVAAAEGELSLTQRALYKNPKSYSSWHHRKWVVARRFTSLEHELQLVGMLLDADERNFHGWNYRRFVVELMGTPAERALDFTRKKIDQNFSNYSAWHSRTVLLPIAHSAEGSAEGSEGGSGGSSSSRAQAAADAALSQGDVVSSGDGEAAAEAQGGEQGLHAGEGSGQAQEAGGTAGSAGSGGQYAGPLVPKPVLVEEYELVKQAFYTEPEDQSGWFYHRWLLGCSWAHWERARGGGGQQEAEEREALLAVVLREQAMCQDLLDIEPDSKWPLLTMARLKEMQAQLLTAAASGAAVLQAEELTGEVRGLYAKLAEVDPMRSGYYKDAVEGRASVVMKPVAA